MFGRGKPSNPSPYPLPIGWGEGFFQRTRVTINRPLLRSLDLVALTMLTRCAGSFTGFGFGFRFPSVGGCWHSRDVKRRRIILLVGCVVTVILMIVAKWPREREPGYGGKQLSEWLTVIAKTNSSDLDGVEAKDAVRRIGTNALPCLVKWVGYEQPAWKRRLLDKYTRWPEPFFNNSIAQWLMGSKGEMLAGDATLGFAVIGPGAARAVPELTQLMRSTNSARASLHATIALARLGSTGFPALEAVLTNRAVPTQLRIQAIQNIFWMGTNASSALPALVGAFEDPDVWVRRLATNVVGEIAPEVLEKYDPKAKWRLNRESWSRPD